LLLKTWDFPTKIEIQIGLYLDIQASLALLRSAACICGQTGLQSHLVNLSKNPVYEIDSSNGESIRFILYFMGAEASAIRKPSMSELTIPPA
jgi:hypothetical protein